jgi:flagellar biogenesis protein FliO
MFGLQRKRRRNLLAEAATGGGLGAFMRCFLAPLGRRSLAGGALEHLGTLALTAQSSLALVRLHNETLLLGITAQNISVLARNDEALTTAAQSNERAATAHGGEHRPEARKMESGKARS